MKIMDGALSAEGGFTPTIPFSGWAGQTPYFLVINVDGEDGSVRPHIVDLDEPGWMTERDGLMTAVGEWVLVAKRTATDLSGIPIIALRVQPGEEPYYAKRHVGMVYGGGGELLLYGIGKKRLDGHMDRLWIMPNGIVVPGEDGDVIAVRMLKKIGS